MNDTDRSTETSEGRPSEDARQSGSTPAGVSVEHLGALAKDFRWRAGLLRDGLANIYHQVDQDSPWAASIRGKARGYDECAAKLESAIRKAAS